MLTVNRLSVMTGRKGRVKAAGQLLSSAIPLKLLQQEGACILIHGTAVSSDIATTTNKRIRSVD